MLTTEVSLVVPGVRGHGHPIWRHSLLVSVASSFTTDLEVSKLCRVFLPSPRLHQRSGRRLPCGTEFASSYEEKGLQGIRKHHTSYSAPSANTWMASLPHAFERDPILLLLMCAGSDSTPHISKATHVGVGSGWLEVKATMGIFSPNFLDSPWCI